MAVIDIFSKRKRRLDQGERVEPYQFTTVPKELRGQVCHIWRDAIGPFRHDDPIEMTPASPSNAIWDYIEGVLAREYGTACLGAGKGNAFQRCIEHVRGATTDQALDVIELSFRAIDVDVRRKLPEFKALAEVSQTPDDAIAELNTRLREHAFGYQFVSGEIVRVDSEFLHAEVVVPALTLLRAEGFEGAEDEFMSAHEHYRHGRIEECLTEALKAFESTMKTICDRRKWVYDQGATAAPLINVLFNSGLIPEFLRNHFGGVRQALEAGVPTLRNKQGGHGQGAEVREVPPYFASHILHLTGANILLLVEAHRAMGN